MLDLVELEVLPSNLVCLEGAIQVFFTVVVI